MNTHLMDLVDAGRIIMVDRGASSSATLVKASDDLTIIEYAKDRDAWICSNDQFRDHRRNKTLGFSGARDLKAFARTRRFEHGFRVAPGLDDLLLDNMRNASGWEPRIGWQAATTISGGNVPPPRPRFGDTNTKQNQNQFPGWGSTALIISQTSDTYMYISDIYIYIEREREREYIYIHIYIYIFIYIHIYI